MTVAKGPLDGLQVLDLSRVLAGPFSAQMLGDLGAKVIKVERPRQGDEARRYGPAYLYPTDGKGLMQSAMYLAANRNKRSIAIDLSSPDGQDLVRRLVAKTDILIENYRVDTLAKYGLDYASLSVVNPKLVYCSITAYGQTGPYRKRPGYDGIFQAAGGLMSVTGVPDGQPGAGPMKTGPSIVDVIAGYNAVIGILAAIQHRDKVSCRGQHIDIALLDSVVAAATHYPQEYLISGKSPVRKGTEGNGGAPSGVFNCIGRPIYLAVGNDDQYRRFCAALGRDDLAEDPRFATIPVRSDNRRALGDEIEAEISKWDACELLAKLEKAKVPACFVNDYEQVFADPQSIHRGLTMTQSHPYAPDLKLIANPIRYSETPLGPYSAPPLLGEHSDEILAEQLDLDVDEIAGLRNRGVIQ
jgi:crotonobetainyl-CoA:carnitine CoA-transferase CaiB-like acyl-CoA transferase